MSKNYLVIGSHSAIGTAIIGRLWEAGHRVITVSRSEKPGMSDGAHHLLADVTGEGALPEDMASMATFLLSGQARWITGQILHVDGGLSAIRN